MLCCCLWWTCWKCLIHTSFAASNPIEKRSVLQTLLVLAWVFCAMYFSKSHPQTPLPPNCSSKLPPLPQKTSLLNSSPILLSYTPLLYPSQTPPSNSSSRLLPKTHLSKVLPQTLLFKLLPLTSPLKLTSLPLTPTLH